MKREHADTWFSSHLKCEAHEEEAIAGWGPVSKLQGLEKWESNAWLFVNCLASPGFNQSSFPKRRTKWLGPFPGFSPLPFLSSHRSWQPGFHRASDERGSPQTANCPPLRLAPSLEKEHNSIQCGLHFLSLALSFFLMHRISYFYLKCGWGTFLPNHKSASSK